MLAALPCGPFMHPHIMVGRILLVCAEQMQEADGWDQALERLPISRNHDEQASQQARKQSSKQSSKSPRSYDDGQRCGFPCEKMCYVRLDASKLWYRV